MTGAMLRRIRVSIRAPARGATPRGCFSAETTLFQFALPRGERLCHRRVPRNHPTFQFALPRGERLDVGLAVFVDGFVSIRAPARGATCVPALKASSTCVSIRAPARGATPELCDLGAGRHGFNSRSREGSDTARRFEQSGMAGFNSRSREGSDIGQLRSLCDDRGFNSRSREGSDLCMSTTRTRFQVSIRAPARGATPPRKPMLLFSRVSIRAPARGATAQLVGDAGQGLVSIRAPARGATKKQSAKYGKWLVSIRAPARGATLATSPQN